MNGYCDKCEINTACLKIKYKIYIKFGVQILIKNSIIKPII